MKKFLTLILLFTVTVYCFAVSIISKQETHFFDSDKMLENWYAPDPEDNNNWKIFLETIGPGDQLFNYFGHTALIFINNEGKSYVSDYGSFSFSDKFYLNFAMGRLWFGCNTGYAKNQIIFYRNAKRTVNIIELNLPEEEKKSIVNFLLTNTSPPYNTYLYNHYTDNCATRIRDIINEATHGDFKAWATSQNGLTFRKQASRALHLKPAIQWVLETVQNGTTDKQNTLWEDMFLPEILQKGVLEYSKLGTNTIDLSTAESKNARKPVYEREQNNLLFSLFAGLIISALTLIGIRKSRLLYRITGTVCDSFFLIISLIMIFFMLFTNHVQMWYNENIFFMNPLLLIPLIARLKKKNLQKNAKIIKRTYTILLTLTGILVFLKLIFPHTFCQYNLATILTVIPYYTVNIFADSGKFC